MRDLIFTVSAGEEDTYSDFEGTTLDCKPEEEEYTGDIRHSSDEFAYGGGTGV